MHSPPKDKTIVGIVSSPISGVSPVQRVSWELRPSHPLNLCTNISVVARYGELCSFSVGHKILFTDRVQDYGTPAVVGAIGIPVSKSVAAG